MDITRRVYGGEIVNGKVMVQPMEHTVSPDAIKIAQTAIENLNAKTL